MAESIFDYVKQKAKNSPKRVAFPEATDSKMLQAIGQMVAEGYGQAVIVGDRAAVEQVASEVGVDVSSFQFVDQNDQEYAEDVLKRYLTLPDLTYGEKSLRRRMGNPLYFALMMEAVGDVDVTFGGIINTTGDFIRAAQTIVGLKSPDTVVSSVGIAQLPNYQFSDGSNMIALADCAVSTDPTAEQLADIAVTTCDTVAAVTGWEPRCALLSYSTCGSGFGPSVDKVVQAVELAKAKRPDLKIDGEFQLDTAIVPEVAAKKVKRPSDVAGKANILIFPDLDAGNIGVKLVQQFGGASAYGPLLQGFRLVCSDSSRGAPVDELVGNIIFSIVRAGEKA